MPTHQAIRYEDHVPAVLRAFASAAPALDAADLDARLRHLVKLRASQLNGCAYCVKLHLREARADGEANERLDRLVVWRHVEDFTPAERAALAFTEALTRLDGHAGDVAVARDALQPHFSAAQMAALGAEIAMINLWNRIAVSNH